MGKITGVYRSSFPCKKKGCNRSFKSESERSKVRAVDRET
jgi:hypothetical protein